MKNEVSLSGVAHFYFLFFCYNCKKRFTQMLAFDVVIKRRDFKHIGNHMVHHRNYYDDKEDS